MAIKYVVSQHSGTWSKDFKYAEWNTISNEILLMRYNKTYFIPEQWVRDIIIRTFTLHFVESYKEIEIDICEETVYCNNDFYI